MKTHRHHVQGKRLVKPSRMRFVGHVNVAGKAHLEDGEIKYNIYLKLIL